MYIKKDYDFYDLCNSCWSGAQDTLRIIRDYDKEEEFMEHLKEVFESYFNNVPTMTEVNDYLWFDWENIFEALGISETEEDEEK